MKTLSILLRIVFMLTVAPATVVFAQTPAPAKAAQRIDEGLTAYFNQIDVTPLKTGLLLNRGFLLDTLLYPFKQLDAGKFTTAVYGTEDWKSLYVRLAKADIANGKFSQTPVETIFSAARQDVQTRTTGADQQVIALGVIDVVGST